MKTRFTVLSLVLLMSVIIVACSPQTAPTDAMDDQSEMPAEEVMETEDDEMMDEEGEMEENKDDEMMDEEMGEDMATTTFVVRIENISTEGGLTVLAPGAYELNDHPLAFFTPGEVDRGEGLEALAEDGDPSSLVDEINQMMGDGMMSFAINAFNTPVDAEAPGPVGPGNAYEFIVEAYPGQYLTFATMFVQSNDWFLSPDADGLTLFDVDGNPLSGDITDQVYLWNAGTEVDQSPGEGADQAPRQSGPNTGEDENGVVSMVESFSDYQILVTITPQQ